MTTRILAALLLALGAQPLAAQILRVPEQANRQRPISIGVSIGFLQTQDRYDGQSGTYWRLGEGFTYRAAVDYGVRMGAFGVAASMASLPISRSGGSASPGSDGDIQLRQYLATFRSPEAQGFFQVVEIGLGLGQWTSYSGNEVLTEDEQKARNALALQFGYGIGFRVGDRMAITLVQDAGTLIGSKEGLPSGASRAVSQYTTRLGARLRLSGGR